MLVFKDFVDEDVNTMPTTTDNPTTPANTTPASTTFVGVPRPSPRVPSKRKSPKKTKRPKKIDVMDMALIKMAKIQEKSDDCFLALEEKHMKMEEKNAICTAGITKFHAISNIANDLNALWWWLFPSNKSPSAKIVKFHHPP